MSGRKESYVTLTTTQRDSMLRDTRIARDEVERERVRNAELQRANNEAQNRISALDNRINTEISGLSEEMREIERRQNDAFNSAIARQRDQNIALSNALERQRADMQRQEASLTESIVAQGNEIRQEMKEQGRLINEAIAQQGADIRQEMNQQRQDLSQMINSVQERINAKEQNHERLALFWASQAEAYMREIENYRHDLFTPNRLTALRTRYSQMQNALDSEAYEAAISIASEVFNGAVVLRNDVVWAETEWLRNFERLSRDVAELSAAVNDAKLLGLEVGEDRIDARVDYWTNGALTRLSEDLSEIQQSLRNVDNTTNNDLVTMITRVNDMDRELSSPNVGLIDSAREALMLSAYRADLVNDVANALTNNGWQIDDFTYRNCEEKEAIHAKIVDRIGNECIVIVEPHNNNGRLENRLQLDFFNDYEADTSNTEIFISSIRKELQDAGIKIDLRCVEGYENQFSDNESIRNIDEARGQTAGRG